MPWVIDGPCAVSTQSPQTSAQWPPRESRTPRAHERRRPLFDRGGEPIRRGRALRAAAPPACVDRQASHLPDGPEHGQHLARPAAPARHRASVLWRPWERRRRRAPHPAWVAAKLVAATPHPPAADRPRCREARSAMRPPQQQPRGHASSGSCTALIKLPFPSGAPPSKRPPPILLPVPRRSKEWRGSHAYSVFRCFVIP